MSRGWEGPCTPREHKTNGMSGQGRPFPCSLLTRPGCWRTAGPAGCTAAFHISEDGLQHRSALLQTAWDTPCPPLTASVLFFEHVQPTGFHMRDTQDRTATAGPLSFGAVDILGRKSLCCEGCPVHCGVSTASLAPAHQSQEYPRAARIRNVPRQCQIPLRPKSPE